MKHIGILAHSAEGATLCYRTMWMEGVRRLGAHERFAGFLKSLGVERPRIKFIPIFAMGGLVQLDAPPLLTEPMMEGFDSSLLQCSSSRMVAEDGVYACPILVGEARARMSDGG